MLGSLALHAAALAVLAGAWGWNARGGGDDAPPTIRVLAAAAIPAATARAAEPALRLEAPAPEPPAVREVAEQQPEALPAAQPPLRALPAPAWLTGVAPRPRTPEATPIPAPAPSPVVATRGADAEQESFSPPRADPSGCPAPDYPPRAHRLGQEGRVVLLLRVAADGSVLDAHIAESSGHRLLDEAALAAARGWRLEPARRGAIAVEGALRVPLRFALGG